MNKVVELLEQHCQWIAIGLGGIFLAWVLWSYVLVSPVAVEIPGSPTALTPGNVDVEVNSIARRVEDDINSKRVTTPPKNSAVEPLKDFTDDMQADQKKLVALQWPGSFSGNAFDPVLADEKDLPPPPDQVAELPVVPPSEVLPGEGLKAARVQAVVGPVGGQPGQPGQPAQPLQPAVPGAAPVLPANTTDINYVYGAFRIEPKEIADEWAKVNVPAGQTTLIIGIKVMRQEQKPDGTWTDPIEIKPLNNGINQWPIPERKHGFQAIGQFEAWFAGPQGQSDLLRPPFYQVISGEGPWDVPMNLDDAKAQVRLLGEAERATRAAEREQQQQQQRDNRTRNRPQPGAEDPGEFDRPRRGRRGEPDFKVEDVTRPDSLADLAGLQLAQAYPPGYPPRYPGGRPNPEDMPPDDMGMNQPWNQPGPAGAGQPQMPALPAAQFDPRQSTTIYGWFFDGDVQEGRTYRYQVLYAIKNPMWQNNQVKNPALANQYSIWSKLDENAWSEPRTVETTTKFFIADRSWTNGSVPNAVRIEVFKWTGGKWQSRVFSVAAGDEIGWNEVGTDWGTHSRLVDVRFDDRLGKAYLLVMGPDGKIAERDPFSDRIDNNEDRQALKFLVQQSQPPIGAGLGTNPDAPMAGR